VKKHWQQITVLVLVFFFFVGCTWSGFGPQNGTVVEMPRPSENDRVEELSPVQSLTVDEENVEKIIEGLVMPEYFTWVGKATYLFEDKKREFTSSAYVDDDRFFVEVREYGRPITSALSTDGFTYILKPLGGVAQKIAQSQRFTYQTITMAASIGTVLPTDRANRREAALSLYNERNCIYVEIQNNKILEKYYLDVEWGYPLRVECYLDEDMLYSFDTISFMEIKPEESRFELPD
jgi:hypothetical protein